MTLIWNGTFRSGDHRTGTNSFSNPAYSYACTPKPYSITVVPAPGGRSGYAGRFETRIGDSCGSDSGDQHNIIQSSSILTQGEYYLGWSEYLDPSYSPSGTWTQGPGLATTGSGIAGGNLYFNTVGSSSLSRNLYVNKQQFPPVMTQKIGAWYDFVVHAKITTGTGFVNLYIREPGEQEYRLRDSHQNIQTYPNGGSSRFGVKVGIYRGYNARNTQIIYILNPKVGMIFDDVAYEDTTPPQPETWTCEFPLNGYERSNLGNRRANPICNPEVELPITADNTIRKIAVIVAAYLAATS